LSLNPRRLSKRIFELNKVILKFYAILKLILHSFEYPTRLRDSKSQHLLGTKLLGNQLVSEYQKKMNMPKTPLMFPDTTS
jgi:hypothetical protein